MAKNNIFEHKNYPTIMFLGLIVISMIVLFSFVDFVEDIDKGFTAYVIQQQNITPELAEPTISDEVGEVYTMQAWSIFYVIIIFAIILVVALSLILKNTIQKNIAEEDKERGFIE